MEPAVFPQGESVCYHEGGELFAEDVESHMAALPEVVTTTEERLKDNALHGYLKIRADVANDPGPRDVFLTGEAETEQKPSVLGRRVYIDNILVTTDSWDTLCHKVDRLPDACYKWNLSINVVNSFWRLRKVDYLSHQVSMEGLEDHPKDLQALTDLSFPSTLRAMQSVMGSLNYYSRFIEGFAIYASVLYKLR
ncbi:unnamed protein product [Phytophthora fragariaefolia]|uniref:Unnamed protein product n=1 Tax=Phytophthora fragariaefolia TaxID=1490495 RepID=A0A9W6XUJ7_9STRA|nr:unnamed protein product [Phytophthora fragariaefolia]